MTRRSILNLGKPDYAGQILQLAQRLATVELRNSELMTLQASYEARLDALEAGGTPTPTPTPAPVFTQQPTISGTVQVGQALSALTYTDGVVSNGTITTRAILLAGVAKAASYVLADADAGKAVTYQNVAAGGSGTTPATATSAAVIVQAGSVTPTPTPSPQAYPAGTVTRTSGPTTYPPTYTFTRPVEMADADQPQGVMQRSQDPTFASGVSEVTRAILAATANYDFGLSAITSGVWYWRLGFYKGQRPSDQQMNWSNIVGLGDATPATITSANAVTAYQFNTATLALTASDYGTFSLNGGVAVGSASLTGSTLSFNSNTTGAQKVIVAFTDYFGNVTTQEIIFNVVVNSPSAHTFTPVTNAPLDTDITSSDSWTIDIAAGTTANMSVVNGAYLKNGVVGTAPTTVAPSDIVKARGHSPAGNNSNVDVAITVGNTVAHFVISTPAALSTNTTFDPATAPAGITLSSDKRTLTRTNTANGSFRNARSTTAKSGKRYAEMTVTSDHLNSVGIVSAGASLSVNIGFDDGNGNAWNSDGGRGTNGSDLYSENGSLPGGRGYTTGDVIGVTWDSSTQFFAFYRNGVFAWTAKNTTLGTAPYLSAGSMYEEGSMTINTGQTPFAFTPPDGFQAWDV